MKKFLVITAISSILYAFPSHSQSKGLSLSELCGANCPDTVIAMSSNEEISVEKLLQLLENSDVKTSLFSSASSVARDISGLLELVIRAAEIQPSLKSKISETIKEARDRSNNMQLASALNAIAESLESNNALRAQNITLALSSGKASVLDRVASANY